MPSELTLVTTFFLLIATGSIMYCGASSGRNSDADAGTTPADEIVVIVGGRNLS
jgi:hypothetical protein